MASLPATTEFRRPAETWIHKASAALGDLGLAVVLVLLLPLALVVIGAPVVLLVRAVLYIAERF